MHLPANYIFIYLQFNHRYIYIIFSISASLIHYIDSSFMDYSFYVKKMPIFTLCNTFLLSYIIFLGTTDSLGG